MLFRDNIQGITKNAIRRLARCGGVKRISGLVHGADADLFLRIHPSSTTFLRTDEVRGVLKHFLTTVMADVAALLDQTRRRTVMSVDIVHALKRQGITLYGFGGY